MRKINSKKKTKSAGQNRVGLAPRALSRKEVHRGFSQSPRREDGERAHEEKRRSIDDVPVGGSTRLDLSTESRRKAIVSVVVLLRRLPIERGLGYRDDAVAGPAGTRGLADDFCRCGDRLPLKKSMDFRAYSTGQDRKEFSAESYRKAASTSSARNRDQRPTPRHRMFPVSMLVRFFSSSFLHVPLFRVCFLPSSYSFFSV